MAAKITNVEKTPSVEILAIIEKDLNQICEMKPAKSRDFSGCGMLVYGLKGRINKFIRLDLNNYSEEEKEILKDCLVEIRKMLRLIQNCFGTKVSAVTINSIIADMFKYIRDARNMLGRVNTPE